MKVLYIECEMGIAGDMLMSALWGLIENKSEIIDRINSIGLPYTDISFVKKKENSVNGYTAKVVINGEEESENNHHISRNLSDINSIIENLYIDEKLKNNVKDLYTILANAESKVHGKPVEMVHFHEVGTLDAIADFTVCSYLLNEIDADIILSSSVNVGNGTVKCAHGVLPVPAPATAEVLNNIPYYKSDIQTELCTPTGATLLKKYSNGFGNMPHITVEKVSCGFGKKTFENHFNCVRVFYGELSNEDTVCELVCNVDDMTAEKISFALEVFINNGALDANAQSIVMKKGRVGYYVHLLCNIADRDKFIELLFKHTSTIGIRECFCSRYMLDREVKKIETPYGKVRVKYSKGYSSEKVKIEYDDIAKIAKENNLTFDETKKILMNFL